MRAWVKECPAESSKKQAWKHRLELYLMTHMDSGLSCSHSRQGQGR